MARGATFAILLGFLATPASAMQLAGCDTPHGYVSLKTRADLPPALQERFRDFANPGQSFNESDVGAPGQGILSIWRKGTRWILETSHGGIALSFEVVAFDVSDDGKTATPLPPAKRRFCEAVREYARMR